MPKQGWLSSLVLAAVATMVASPSSAEDSFKVAIGQLEIRDRSRIDSDALKKFRAQLKGGLILPTDPGYEAARRVFFWNPDTERRPALVARCVHADCERYRQASGIRRARGYIAGNGRT